MKGTKGMNILVTGHEGYIGTILVPKLLRNGHRVTGMDSELFNRCTFDDGITEVPNIRKDIRDVTTADLRGFDVVLHLAGLSNDPLGNFKPELTDEINNVAAVRLGEMSKSAGVRRFVFSSSCSNYGVAGDNYNDETSPLSPYTPYAKAKVDAEKGLAPLSDDNFSVILLRNATVYGHSPRIRWDLVLNNLTAWAATTGEILLKSDGTPWRGIVHVEDVADAFVAVTEAPLELVHNEVFNVGSSSENYRVRELAEIVASTVPGSKIAFAPDAKPDPRCYRVNCDKLPRIVKTYRAKWTAKAAAKQIYDAIRRIGLTKEDFEGARFARLAHLKKLMADGVVDQTYRMATPILPKRVVPSPALARRAG
jgi:nucleoside-diphosphate-sugar epimerase